MDIQLNSKATKFHKRYQRKKLWQRVVSALGCVVVFCTTYALILPAITQEQETFCGLEAHTHEDACYVRMDVQERALICSEASLGLHIHGDSCYSAEGVLICGQADYVVHSHEDGCYDQMGNLICALPERAQHVHTESCYILRDGHVHGEECYVTEQGALTCELEEDSGHSHGEECYAPGETVLCQIPENHAHEESCREQSLTCQLAENHVHDESCQEQSLTCQLAENHVHDESCRTQSLICQMTEGHIHDESCQVQSLVCALAEGHVHEQSCYGQSLICTDDSEEHIHAETCYVTEQVCTQEENHLHGQTCYVSEQSCTQEENHIHGETCYVSEQSCAQEENHLHGDSCYTSQAVCGQEENHVHAESCYTSQLVCTVPEGHIHETACMEQVLMCETPESEGHAHEDACYEQISTLVCTQEEIAGEPILICTEPTAQVHVHSDACYDAAPEPELTCGLAEDADHAHSQRCYGAWALNCMVQEHEHILICYSDANADLESAAAWEQTMAGVERTGIWRDDVIAIAESQLGYRESTKNYVVLEDGVTIKGYSRYGAWYGLPYGDWCAMFASFCLHYAQVENMPLECNVPDWIEQLQELELYYPAGEYEPVPGDLIFFDWDDDGLGDHVGLVQELTSETEEEPAQIMTIQGNTTYDTVGYVSYEPSDPDIMGYGALPYQAEEEELAQVNEVIARIDEMPSAEEIDAKVEEFAEAGDEDGEIAWLEMTYQQVAEVYAQYDQLTEEQKSLVTNREKLLKLEYIWSAATLEATEISKYYCDKIAHEHDDTCRDEEGELVCPKYEHIHTEACTVKPEEIVKVEHSALGTYYHMQSTPYYQVSSCKVDNGDKDVVVLTFVLVPDSVVSGPTDASWTAESAVPVPWTAKTNANYLVAYCAEPYTDYSTSGESYGSYVIDDARFTSDIQRRALAGVIAHSYPFLSYEEMKAELRAAYASGELEHNIADCGACTEHEYMSAVQAAIWSLVDSSSQYEKFSEINTDVAADNDKYVHPFQAGYAGHLLTDKSNMSAHCNAIKNWLLKQTAAEAIAVSSHNYEITEGEYGTYNLTVNVQLNRAVIAGEQVSLQLLAGECASDEIVVQTGESSFTVSVNNVTEEELLAAEINLTASGKNLQAYFFDSSTSQDFISGLWEEYEDELTFRIGVESTTVAVHKVWTDGEPENIPSVSVQLYANGEAHGDPVKLSGENGWSYQWQDLMKKDLLGNEIQYTIQEEQVEGYFSTVEKVDGAGNTITKYAWMKTDRFVEGGRYLLVSSDGALGMQTYRTRPSFTWEAVDLNDVSGTAAMLIWQASSVNENGGAIMTNSAYPDNPMGITETGNFIYPEGTLKYDNITNYTSVRSELYLDESGHLYMINPEGTRRYLQAMYVDGEFRTTDDADGADLFDLYELQTVEIPASEINYVLTNTQIRSETIDITVTKTWEGRPDEIYPESAVVTLVQNGRAYGTYVTLNAQNQWSAMWHDLPAADNDGNEFVYSVQEVSHDDYTAEVTVTKEDSGDYTIHLKNVWTPEYAPVELQKVDASTLQPLSDAVFDVYLVTNQTGVPVPGAINVYGILVDTVTVDASGKLLMELPVGESYYLVETKAPAGYHLLKDPIGFTVTKRGTRIALEMLTSSEMAEAMQGTTAILTVKNMIGYTLPKTGGTGTIPYTAGGALLMMAACILLMYNHRKRRREDYQSS